MESILSRPQCVNSHMYCQTLSSIDHGWPEVMGEPNQLSKMLDSFHYVLEMYGGTLKSNMYIIRQILDLEVLALWWITQERFQCTTIWTQVPDMLQLFIHTYNKLFHNCVKCLMLWILTLLKLISGPHLNMKIVFPGIRFSITHV